MAAVAKLQPRRSDGGGDDHLSRRRTDVPVSTLGQPVEFSVDEQAVRDVRDADDAAMASLLAGAGEIHGGIDTPFTTVEVSTPRMNKAVNIFAVHTTYRCIGIKASGERMEIERRYSDFLALQTSLRKQYPALRGRLRSRLR